MEGMSALFFCLNFGMIVAELMRGLRSRREPNYDATIDAEYRNGAFYTIAMLQVTGVALLVAGY